MKKKDQLTALVDALEAQLLPALVAELTASKSRPTP
jgi:hypothetical protein